MDTSPPGGISTKITLLWNTNKPLFIGIIVGIVLLVLALIFLVLFFTVIRPGISSGSAPVVAQTKTSDNFATIKEDDSTSEQVDAETTPAPSASNTSSTSTTPTTTTTTTSSKNTTTSPSTTTTTARHALGYQTLRTGHHLKREWFN